MFLLILFVSLSAMAQEHSLRPPDSIPRPPIKHKWPDTTVVIDFVDPEPEFPGGYSALIEFIKENVQYPEQALADSIQGRVYVSFVVDSTGKITQPEVARGIHPLLDAEALRVVQLMPDWIPAELNGKRYKTRVRLPITFVLDDGEEPEK